MHSRFYNIYKVLKRQPKLSLLGLIVLIIGLGFLASKITFEEDITKLIPTNSKSKAFQKVLKNVNFADKIIINFKKQQNAKTSSLTDAATFFIDSVNTLAKPFIKNIQGRVEDEDALATIDFVYNNLPLFLEPEDYSLIEQKLKKDSIKNKTDANYKTLISPSGIIAKDVILKDPLGLSFLGLEHLKALSFGDDFKLNNGFLVSKDDNNLLLFITPNYASSDTNNNTPFSKQLHTIKNTINTSFKNEVEVEYYGGALIAVANANQIKQDIQFTISIALTVLLVILILFYKKLLIPFILFLPTVIGGLFAVVTLYVWRDSVSAISLGIGSVLLGVTLDYSLHILTHIRGNNSIESLYKDIAKPILVSSFTTALAFLCLLFLQSQALQDLGVFAAVSVISASVFALLFIPQVYKNTVKNKQKLTVLDKFASYNMHKSKLAIITVAIFLVASLFTYNKVTFNNNLSSLNYQPESILKAEKNLDALTNVSSKSIYIVAFGDTEQQALKANDAAFLKLKALKNENKVITFSSIASLLKSNNLQEQKIKFWNQFWTDAKIENVKNNLVSSGNVHGFKPTTFNKFYNLLNNDFNTLQIKDYAALQSISTSDYVTTNNNITTVATLVKVKDENLNTVISAFKNNKQVVVIDRQQMNETFLGNLKTDFNSLVLYSLIVVLLLLLIYYKSVSLTLVTAIPIALTWLVTIGIMGLFNIKFNIFNIIISTFIFGLGVDYCIFLTNGLLHEYKTGDKAVATHKVSIILSVITTILGVGVLVFAKHPALHSIALVSIVGIVSALIIAFTLQPLLFKLFIGSKNKRPISLRLLLHSVISFGYFGIGGALLSVLSVFLIKIVPLSKKKKMPWFHKVLSKFKKSVLYTNWFVDKKIINPNNEIFNKQAVIIANHTSFLDILAIGMLHPKLVFLVNDWVYNSPVFGKAVKLAGFYPVSSGIENGVSHLQEKVNQGYSLIAFPEGTRSTTNKVKRFHKGAFYLAEQFKLDIVPVVIHGNAEVLPKGSFVIRNGSITLKVLDRIPFDSKKYGENYSVKTRKIGAYFRSELDKLRTEIEHKKYFHNLVLQEYRYKGNLLFKAVKKDLNSNAKLYHSIINTLPSKSKIIHSSKDFGQLDFLLALHRPERTINTHIKNQEVSKIVAHSFITNYDYKINVCKTVKDLTVTASDIAIINNEDLKAEEILEISKNVSMFLLLKESKKQYQQIIINLEFTVNESNTDFIILNKNK